MTHQLHDVLDDIALDVPPTDLVAGVASRASRIRWTRRAAAGGTALAVAAVVGVVTIGLPSWQQTTSPDREPPATRPTMPLLAPTFDLDAARTGTLPTTTGLVLVREADGALRTVALDVQHGDAVSIDVAAPDDVETAQLSRDGSRALLVGATTALVLDLATGQSVLEVTRETHQPVALSWDSRSVITFQRDLTPEPSGLGTRWQLTTIDIATGAITQLGEPLQRSSAAGEIFAAPFGASIFVRYDGSLQDVRLHRIDLATGMTVFSENYSALKTSSMHWRADGLLLAAETTSAVRIMTPNDEGGDLIGSMRKLGVPLGFAGPDHLAWWRPATAGASLGLSDLEGNELEATAKLSTSGTVIAVATALG